MLLCIRYYNTIIPELERELFPSNRNFMHVFNQDSNVDIGMALVAYFQCFMIVFLLLVPSLH